MKVRTIPFRLTSETLPSMIQTLSWVWWNTFHPRKH